jgi:hypothetical protein
MGVNNTLVEKIKQDMIQDVVRKKNIVNVERYLLEYLRKLDAVDIMKKYRCSLADAIETLDFLKKSNQVKKIILTLD